MSTWQGGDRHPPHPLRPQLNKGWVSSQNTLFGNVQYVEELKDKTKFLTSISRPLGAASDQVLRLRAGDTSAVPNGVTKKHLNSVGSPPASSTATVQPAAPFDFRRRPHEIRLFKSFLRAATFYKEEGKKALFVDGEPQIERLQDHVARGAFDELIHLPNLYWSWNNLVALNDGSCLKVGDVELTAEESANCFPKSKAMLTTCLQQLAKGFARKYQPKVAQGLIGGAVDTPPDSIPVSIQAPVTVPTLAPPPEAAPVPLEVPASRPRKRLAPLDDAPEKRVLVEDFRCCSEHLRHKASSQCAFYLWTQAFPKVSKVGKLSMSISHKVRWVEGKLETVFTGEDGMFRSLPEWTWSGPPCEL